MPQAIQDNLVRVEYRANGDDEGEYEYEMGKLIRFRSLGFLLIRQTDRGVA